MLMVMLQYWFLFTLKKLIGQLSVEWEQEKARRSSGEMKCTLLCQSMLDLSVSVSVSGQLFASVDLVHSRPSMQSTPGYGSHFTHTLNICVGVWLDRRRIAFPPQMNQSTNSSPNQRKQVTQLKQHAPKLDSSISSPVYKQDLIPYDPQDLNFLLWSHVRYNTLTDTSVKIFYYVKNKVQFGSFGPHQTKDDKGVHKGKSDAVCSIDMHLSDTFILPSLVTQRSNTGTGGCQCYLS